MVYLATDNSADKWSKYNNVIHPELFPCTLLSTRDIVGYNKAKKKEVDQLPHNIDISIAMKYAMFHMPTMKKNIPKLLWRITWRKRKSGLLSQANAD